MSTWLSDREQRLVAGAETASTATQIVSNGEYLTPPQSETQKRVEHPRTIRCQRQRLGLSREHLVGALQTAFHNWQLCVRMIEWTTDAGLFRLPIASR